MRQFFDKNLDEIKVSDMFYNDENNNQFWNQNEEVFQENDEGGNSS